MAQTDQIRVRAELFREEDQYVAIYPELNVSSFGETREEALRSFREAMSLFLEECQRMGTLRQVLEEAGFSHTTSPTHRWIPPKPIGTEQLLSLIHI